MVFTIELACVAAAMMVLLLWYMRHLMGKIEASMISSLWAIEDRCDKASNKTEQIELRAMLGSLRLHETLRLFMQMISEFQPTGDPTWLPRQLADLVTNTIEVRMRHSGGTRADYEALMRFIMRVAVDRSLKLTYVRRC